MTLPQIQNIDPNTLLLIVGGCGLLCVVGVLLFFGLQIIGTGINAIFNLFGLVLQLINSGPVGWCGCLVILIACGAIVGGAWLITTCNANPYSMNFCRLLGR
jgi:hypothetical protein